MASCEAPCALPACPQVWLCSGWPRSPRQALPADSVGRGGAVGLLEAVDEGTGQAGLAAVVSPAVLELPGRAGHALRVPAAAVAAVLQGTGLGARLWQRAPSGTECPFFGGTGWQGLTWGPQNPAESSCQQCSSQETLKGPRLLPSWSPLECSACWKAAAAPCPRKHHPGASHQSKPPPPRPSWDPLQHCPAGTQTRAAQPCSVTFLGTQTRGNLDFEKKGKSGCSLCCLKSLSTSCFHCLTLLPG